MAIRVNGDLAVDNGTVTALADDAELTAGINITPNLTVGCEDHRGILTLSGNPTITAEGTHYAIAFWAYEEAWENDPVALDPTIGALEGGMLSYAENSFDGEDFVSVWTYATDKIALTDEYSIEGASQRVSIGREDALAFVTNEGEPATGLEIVRAIAADGTEYEAAEWLDGSHAGYYRFPRALPDGVYTIVASEGLRTASATVTIGGDRAAGRRARALPVASLLRRGHSAVVPRDSIDWAIPRRRAQRHRRHRPHDAGSRHHPRSNGDDALESAAGNPEPQQAAPFTDVVEADLACAGCCLGRTPKACSKAYAGTGTFGPDDTLSREQAAVVMMRWQQQRGARTSPRAPTSPPSPTRPPRPTGRTRACRGQWRQVSSRASSKGEAARPSSAPQDECQRAQIAAIMMRALEEAPTDTVA